jgi:uncharacterized Zn finger protein
MGYEKKPLTVEEIMEIVGGLRKRLRWAVQYSQRWDEWQTYEAFSDLDEAFECFRKVTNPQKAKQLRKEGVYLKWRLIEL